jgi:alpha-amylase
MNKIHFLLGVHNHQPIGNFGFVFEKAYELSYLPFLDAMERHPKLHWNMHTTGILWEWLEANRPGYMKRVAEQVRLGRLELLTGGYYEPILPALPDADKKGQIAKLSAYLRDRFEFDPKGMWLAERVWEPHLAKVLHDAGLDYTLVDDSHFLSTGLGDDEMVGSFLTEEQGATLKLVPIRKDLRYAIPFKDPGETLTLLRRFATPSAHRALTMFDDGEKFGLWPDTQDVVYKGGWLENFLTVLESNADWIYTTRISDYLKTHVPHGRVYLPTASYYEMSEWSLPAASQKTLSDVVKGLPASEEVTKTKQFLRGGFWRNFLTKYDESNNIHKKMLHVSSKVHQALGSSDSSLPKKISAKGQKMLDALWAGQCNCAYWHGVFGGLYLPHLRQALYRNLLAAEQMADLELKAKKPAVKLEDFDKDGLKEVLIESLEQNLYLSPHNGGSIFEWDLRPRGINLQNVLTRRAEGYHRQLAEVQMQSAAAHGETKTIHDVVRVKEAALERRLHTDWYRRASLLDHFFHPDTTLDQFFRCQYGEQGDFVKTGYDPEISKSARPEVRFTRTGTVWTGEQQNTVLIEKMVSLEKEGWRVDYRLRNTDGPTVPLWWACEMSFGLATPERVEPQTHEQATEWAQRDQAFGLRAVVEFKSPMDLWEFPLQTVSLSEEGFERTYQGTVLAAHAKVTLQPGEEFTRSWRVRAENL